MANAFVPDEKRRHQYVPVNEEPPDYQLASGRDEEAGPSMPAAASSHRPRKSRTRRRSQTSPASLDRVDIAGDDEGEGASEDGGDGHAPDHRARSSEDSSEHEFEEMELDTTEVPKEPVLFRLSKKIHRMTVSVDRVLYTYVNATLMRYIYGALLGLLVITLVYLFGGSLPKLTLPKRYREDALRAYINEETSQANIKQFTEQLAAVYAKHQQVDALFDSSKLADWCHDEFVKLGVARNAVDVYFVYYPEPAPGAHRLEISNAQGHTFAAFIQDDAERLQSFITHGAGGNVSAPLVYANYATPKDIEWLRASGVEIAGAIVLFKRDRSVQLSQQLLSVQMAGAVGALTFASTTDYGAGRGSVFPDGPYMPDTQAMNGDAALTWLQPGDVLTPGFPSFENVKVYDPSDTAALIKIPALSISAADALDMLAFLTDYGPQAKSDWTDQAGDFANITLYTGTNIPGAPQVRLEHELVEALKHPIFDVLSEIDGDESDQVLIVGAPLSSLSTVATLLEVSRVFADLVTRYAWRPRRSVIFAIWGGTEQNYLGSTEWTENQMKSLRHQGIAYINLANAVSLSNQPQIRATPSLSDALIQAMQHVQNTFQNATLADDLGLSLLSSTSEPLGFSDSIGFEAHVGLPVADIGYPDSNLYSACLNSAECIDEHIDPNFSNHAVLAKTFAMVILELVDEKFIPLDIHAYARSLEAGITSLSKKYPHLNFGGDMNRVLQTLDQATDLMMQWKNDWQKAYIDNKEIESPTWALKRSNWNYAVTSFHRNMLRSSAWTTWFAHPIYGPSLGVDELGHRTWLFPHIEDAIGTGDMVKAQGVIDILGQTILQAAQELHP